MEQNAYEVMLKSHDFSRLTFMVDSEYCKGFASDKSRHDKVSKAPVARAFTCSVIVHFALLYKNNVSQRLSNYLNPG